MALSYPTPIVEFVRRAGLTIGALGACLAVVPAAAWAQNAPPKPETDCGLTAMCPRDSTVASHGHAPSWVVALILLAVVVTLLAVAYRLIVARVARN